PRCDGTPPTPRATTTPSWGPPSRGSASPPRTPAREPAPSSALPALRGLNPRPPAGGSGGGGEGRPHRAPGEAPVGMADEAAGRDCPAGRRGARWAASTKRTGAPPG